MLAQQFSKKINRKMKKVKLKTIYHCVKTHGNKLHAKANNSSEWVQPALY